MNDEATRHNQAAYDKIAALYAQRQAMRGLSFPDLREAFAARLIPAANLADLGCGPAIEGASFAAAGHRVTGIDRSAGMLAAARRVLPVAMAHGLSACRTPQRHSGGSSTAAPVSFMSSCAPPTCGS